MTLRDKVCKADTRTYVVVVLCSEITRTAIFGSCVDLGSHQAIHRVHLAETERAEAVGFFPGYRLIVIADAEVQSEIRESTPVVLKVTVHANAVDDGGRAR